MIYNKFEVRDMKIKRVFFYCPECGSVDEYCVDVDENGNTAEPELCSRCRISLFKHRELIQITDTDDIAKLRELDNRRFAGIEQSTYIKDKYRLEDNPVFNKSKFDKRIRQMRNNIMNRSEPLAPSPKCPTCGSRRISKISTASRAASTITFGLASNKIGKQFHCDNCGYNW